MAVIDMSYNILFVDDDADFRSEFRECFYDYGIVEASNGKDALDILKRPNEIDLVILDENMPGMRGTEVLKEMKKLVPGLAIIIMTGYSTKDVAVAALKGAADDYVEKPINLKKTKEIIEGLLEKKKGIVNLGAADIKDKVERVKRFAERNYDKKVSLKEAAAIVCLSPKYLSRAFREYACTGFSDYKLKIKIDKAKEWLTSTGYTVDQISYKLGYQNAESFIRIFKEFAGCTPTGYRKRSYRKLRSHSRRTK
jgi:two-component system response regulator YesN